MPHEARWIWRREAILRADVRPEFVEVSIVVVAVVAVAVRWVIDIKSAEWYMLNRWLVGE